MTRRARPIRSRLSGTGVAETQLLTFNVSSLSFGNVSVGSNSSLPATLTNTGNRKRDDIFLEYFGRGLHGQRHFVRENL